MLKGFSSLGMVCGEIGMLEDQKKDGLTKKFGIEWIIGLNPWSWWKILHLLKVMFL